MLIDTHCHFNHERLSDDIPGCLTRAEAAGVCQMIVVGFDLPSSEQAVALAARYPGVLFAAVGVHPHDAKDWNDDAARRLAAWTRNPQVVAIGEIGLDFYHDFSPRDAQYTAFQAQLTIARETELPIIIHCREAYPETIAVLAEAGRGIGGVMHCWAGTVAQAQQVTALGLALGFGGTLTFKNADEVRAGALAVPIESLLVETDAPYLAPVPHRGKRCEPAYTRLAAEKLAELRGIPYPDLAALTTANACRIFPRLAGC